MRRSLLVAMAALSIAGSVPQPTGSRAPKKAQRKISESLQEAGSDIENDTMNE